MYKSSVANINEDMNEPAQNTSQKQFLAALHLHRSKMGFAGTFLRAATSFGRRISAGGIRVRFEYPRQIWCKAFLEQVNRGRLNVVIYGAATGALILSYLLYRNEYKFTCITHHTHASIIKLLRTYDMIIIMQCVK